MHLTSRVAAFSRLSSNTLHAEPSQAPLKTKLRARAFGCTSNRFPPSVTAKASEEYFDTTIRQASKEDIDTIAEIVVDARLHWPRGLMEDQLISPRDDKFIWVLECTPISSTSLQNLSRRLGGFISVWRVADELQIIDVAVSMSDIMMPLARGDDRVQISEYSYFTQVAMDLRRKGYARRLLQHLEHQASTEFSRPKPTKIVLEVREDNRAAIALYATVGFQDLGVRPNYYRDGCGAVAMQKLLY